MKIFINPGHCPGKDPGAVSEVWDVNEAAIVRDIGAKLCNILENMGHDVYSMQSDNLAGEDGYEYEESVVCVANEWDADYFISLHCNAFNGRANGTEVFYGSTKGLFLAGEIMDRLHEALDTEYRGTKQGHHLCVIKNTTMPAVLVEIAFIDNYNDCQLLINKQDEIARAIAEGIEEFIGGD